MSEVSYSLEEVHEGRYKVETEDEELEIVIHPVLIKVFKKDQKFSFSVNNVVSVYTNTPRFGPLCSANMLSSRPAKIKKVESLVEPKIRVKVGDREFEVIIAVTNISIYPEYRDSSGAPCTIVSTVVMY
ncbi:hypothetical protein [Stygiolobus caldivivus]|uniref:Uncharacterized protein n=1 Tax=Stygiolobus caldivivus TaxID=2824673 RepID=A0A8D5ZI07_9CREN|nr:hypothetical protein [Stygiolobus caldivivus]BCU70184.1 hypothetical protein KN1_14810 [Stygiolobus caldivivus]